VSPDVASIRGLDINREERAVHPAMPDFVAAISQRIHVPLFGAATIKIRRVGAMELFLYSFLSAHL
jgi:hypothetical protein